MRTCREIVTIKVGELANVQRCRSNLPCYYVIISLALSESDLRIYTGSETPFLVCVPVISDMRGSAHCIIVMNGIKRDRLNVSY